MVEKMEFERKEKRNHIWRIIFILILGIMLFIGYMWMLVCSASDVSNPILCMIQLILFSSASLMLLYAGVLNLLKKSEDYMQKNIREFHFNVKVDGFLEYLGDKEIQVRLKCMTDDFSPKFENAILNPKITYYVRKKDSENIEIVLRKKNKEISCWDTSCEFLFKHYELIYSEWVKPKEEA